MPVAEEAYMALAKVETRASRRWLSLQAAASSRRCEYSRSSTRRCVNDVGSLKCTGMAMRVMSWRAGLRGLVGVGVAAMVARQLFCAASLLWPRLAAYLANGLAEGGEESGARLRPGRGQRLAHLGVGLAERG